MSLTATLYIVMRCDKYEAISVRKWLIEEIMPRGFNKIIESSNRQHQLAIDKKYEEHQLMIADKDQQHQLLIADKDYQHQLLIADKDDEIRDLVQNRHVPRIGEHDNILCAIEKNETDELGKPGDHPYYMIRCQRMGLQERLHIKNLQYPNMIIKRPTYDAANTVICWVEFKNYIGKDSYYRNHF